MNILLINHYAGSRIHGMEYRPYYLAREWVKLGHKTTIVAGSFSHVRSRSPDVSGTLAIEYIDGIRYVWLKTIDYEGNGIKRVLSMFAFVWSLFRNYSQFVKDFKPDVVVASSTYPLDIFPANRIAKRSGARLIFEIHDLWPLSPMELGGMSPWHPFIMIMQRAENYVYRVADGVVSMLPNADVYMQENGLVPHKYDYIPNGIDAREWENPTTLLPLLHYETLKKLKQEGNVLVGYAGAHGLANALRSLVDASPLLKNKHIVFVLVGQGPEKEFLKEKVSAEGLKDVVFLPPVQKEAIPSLLAYMDILYIGLKNQPLFRYGVSPNKLMDYMMASKPVIYAIKASNDMVSESRCGISIPPENPKAIADAIMQLVQMSSRDRCLMGKRGRDYVQIRHDYRILAKRFIEVIKERLTEGSMFYERNSES